MHENENVSYRWRKLTEESIEEQEEIAGNHYDPCRITRKKHKVWVLLKIEMPDKNQILK